MVVDFSSQNGLHSLCQPIAFPLVSRLHSSATVPQPLSQTSFAPEKVDGRFQLTISMKIGVFQVGFIPGGINIPAAVLSYSIL